MTSPGESRDQQQGAGRDGGCSGTHVGDPHHSTTIIFIIIIIITIITFIFITFFIINSIIITPYHSTHHPKTPLFNIPQQCCTKPINPTSLQEREGGEGDRGGVQEQAWYVLATTSLQFHQPSILKISSHYSFLFVCIHPSTHLVSHPSIYPSTHPPIHPCIHSSIHPQQRTFCS